MISPRNFIALYFTFRYMSHFEFFFVRVIRSVSRFMFAYEFLIILSPNNKTPLHAVNCFFPLLKINRGHSCVHLIEWLFILSLWFMCLLMPIFLCIDYSRVIVSLSQVVSMLQLCFSTLVLCCIYRVFCLPI